jgi:ferredoxin
MIEPTIQILRGLGVPADQIKSEAFVAAKRVEAALASSDSPAAPTPPTTGALSPSSSAGDQTGPTLTFARSMKSASLTTQKTLLEVAEDAGINIDFECRSGICGRCKTRLLAGSVNMEVEDALDDKDKSDNVILLCQARSTGNVTLEA